jgi:HTH-type transcriptional regulator/antitoxin HigA
MEGGLMAQFEGIMNAWPMVASYLTVPSNDDELNRLVAFSDYLMDSIGDDENDERLALLDTLGVLIAEYEKTHIPEPAGTPIECLLFFMEEHGLKQKDLVEIGSPGVVSEVLSGKRELNTRQIKALSERFGCSPAVFI